MTLSEYINKECKVLATTYPLVAPSTTSLPFITYKIEGKESQKSSSGGVDMHSVTIIAHAETYDNAEALGGEIEDAFLCKSEEEEIIGSSLGIKTTEYIAEPLACYATIVEINIFKGI